MIRIAVVEDEKYYIDQLLQYLEQYQREKGEEFEITVYRDGDGITEKYKPCFDIILMDIQMKFVDGMTAAEEIRKMDSEVVIIFITNMAQYAIRGYEVDALDYVLKPVSYFAFSQKISRAISRIKKKESTYITLQIRNGILRLATSDIFYIESEGHNLIYHTSKGRYLASGTMKSAEEQFADSSFSRGNKCYLINLEHVEEIRDKCAIVRGAKLQISRPRMSEFMKDLTRYWGGKA